MKQFSVSLLKCLFVGLSLQSALLASPVNDSFSAPTVVTGLPATATGSNVDATMEVGESFPTAYTIEPFQPAQASVWFTWTSPVTGSVQIDTSGSDFDTILAVWTGSTLATLNEIDSNDFYYGPEAAVFIDVVQGTTYRIAVYGNEDARGEISLNIENDTKSRISGVVTGPDGTTPLAGIDAAAYYKVGEGSEAYWQYAHYGVTRADGTYTIRGLTSDTYRVEFADYENESYQSEYYDDIPELDSAVDITVATGTTVTGINASLELASKITGIVTGSDGITPLADIGVTAYRFNSATNFWVYASYARTRVDGTYQVGSLSPGTYRLEFSDFGGNYLPEYYDDAPDLASATNITAAANTTVQGINASLSSGSKITGTVTGPDESTPVAGILVHAYQFNNAADRWEITNSEFTEADGTYQIGGLSGGTYRIEFAGFASDYSREFYDNAVDVNSATNITVADATTASNINASLALAPKITGTVTGPNGTIPLAGITVTAYRLFDSANSLWFPIHSVTTAADGSYQLNNLEFGGLPGGPYRVGFSDPSGNYATEFYQNAVSVVSATSIVIPENTTASGIDASMTLASKITGTVTGPNGTDPLVGIEVRAYSPATPWETLSRAMTQADGSYQLGGLAAGTYHISFTDPAGNYLNEVYNNATSPSSATNISVGESVTVSGLNASLALASKITGTVTGPDGTTPLVGIRVAIFQNPLSFFPLRTTSTQVDGSYQLGGLVGGTYQVEFRDFSGQYITEYYHDALDLFSATNLPVSPGTTVSGINASLVLPSLPEVMGFRKTGPTSFEMSFTGTPGTQYLLQQSTSLTAWENVGTPFTFRHGVNLRSVSSSQPKMFWRVKTIP
jgi:5-hydroxyisourate hydrolase-like protein (transthyretin family)